MSSVIECVGVAHAHHARQYNIIQSARDLANTLTVELLKRTFRFPK